MNQEKSEMDDFERRKKNFGSKGKILFLFSLKNKFLTDTLAKMSRNYFCIFVSEHSKHFFYFKKNLHFLVAGGTRPL